MIIITIIITALYLKQKADEGSTNAVKYMEIILISHGFPTLFLAITVYLSYGNEKYVEMLGLSIIIPNIIIVCLTNMTDVIEMNSSTRNV